MQSIDFDVLPVQPAHAIAAGRLPKQHADPFDRMLIGQALIENVTLVSHDQAVARYDVPVLGVSAK
jgi:PIN domain nuclease of toxin-antitoxin system